MSIQQLPNTYESFKLTITPRAKILIGDGYTSFKDYLSWYESGSKKGKKPFYKKMITFQQALEYKYGVPIDPIEYLIKLYYGDKLSVEDVFDRVKDMGFTYKDGPAALGKAFTIRFGWRLRDINESPVGKEKRIGTGYIEKMNQPIKSKNEGKYQLIETVVKSNTANIICLEEFDVNEFEKLLKYQQILYLLSFINGLTINDFESLHLQGVGVRILSNAVSEMVKDTVEGLGIQNFSVNQRNIHYLIGRGRN